MTFLGVSNPVQECIKFEDFVSSNVILVTCSLLGVAHPPGSGHTLHVYKGQILPASPFSYLSVDPRWLC